jgi:hypothetical protein
MICKAALIKLAHPLEDGHRFWRSVSPNLEADFKWKLHELREVGGSGIPGTFVALWSILLGHRTVVGDCWIIGGGI